MIKLIKNEHELIPELPFFAKEAYLKSKSKYYGWFTDGKFILPFTLFKKLIFKRLVFTTEVLYIEKYSIEEEKEFLNNIVKYVKNNNISDCIFKPQPSAIFNTYPNDGDVFRWGTFTIDIKNNLEEMIKRISKSQRNYIRRAIKDGVVVEKSSNYKEIYTLTNDTLSRQKIQLLICEKEFKKQYDLLHPNEMLMFKATYQNKIQGVLTIFIDKNTAYAEYAGSILKPKHGSLKLLHLKAMEYLIQNHNIKTYDFIGAIPDIKENSKEAGIQKFKKEFGASIKEGYQFRVIINPFRHYLFDKILKYYFKLQKIEYEDPVEKYRKLSKSYLEV